MRGVEGGDERQGEGREGRGGEGRRRRGRVSGFSSQPTWQPYLNWPKIYLRIDVQHLGNAVR